MLAQQKLLRVFTLIGLLRRRPGYKIPQLARLLEIDSRSVYRYLQLLGEIGYLIDKDDRGRYFLFEPGPEDAAEFQPEESGLLHTLVQGLDAGHPLREQLLRKLYTRSGLIPLAEDQLRMAKGAHRAALELALQTASKVRLAGYESVSSQTVSDRIVDPVALSEDGEYLHALEPGFAEPKAFKLDRIQRVDVLAEAAGDTGGHADAAFTDAFGMFGTQRTAVELALTLRAWRLLIEERPVLRGCTRADGDTGFPYRFEGAVAGFEGIGRFILGLPGEIRVLEPAGLRKYVLEKAAAGY
jgi:predicted DNA-binding transcriptional regulator YafY